MLPYELLSFLVNFTIPTLFSLALSCSVSWPSLLPTSSESLSTVMVFAAISSSVFFCSSEHSTVVIKLRISISFSRSIILLVMPRRGGFPRRTLVTMRKILPYFFIKSNSLRKIVCCVVEFFTKVNRHRAAARQTCRPARD